MASASSWLAVWSDAHWAQLASVMAPAGWWSQQGAFKILLVQSYRGIRKPTLARVCFHVLAWRVISGLFVLECGSLGHSRSHCPDRAPFHVLVMMALLLSSCDARRDVFLRHKKKCLPVAQEEMSSCDTGRNVLLWYKKRCLLLTQEEMSSCDARRMSSCGTRRYFFLCHKKTRLLVSQEDISSCVTSRNVFFGHKKKCFLVLQEDISACVTRRLSSCVARRPFFLWHKNAVFLSHEKTCLLAKQEQVFA